jgi:hypothetical protein
MENPRLTASSISLKSTPLGVNVISAGVNPARSAMLASWRETTSTSAPALRISFRIETFVRAFAAYLILIRVLSNAFCNR